jgi:hypothetical protein
MDATLRLQDYVIRRAVQLERVKFYLANRLVDRVEQIHRTTEVEVGSELRRVSSLASGTVLSRLKHQFRTNYEALEVEYAGDLLELVDQEADFIQTALKKSMPVKFAVDGADSRNLVGKVSRVTTMGVTLKEYFHDLAFKAYAEYRSTFRQGVLRKDPLANILTAAATQRRQARQRVERMVRTTVGSFSTWAREEFYQANSRLFQGVSWVLLDGKSAECQVHAGEVFTLGAGARPPGHFNCSATTMPILKPWDQLMERAGPSVKASLTGAKPRVVSLQEWLSGQPDAIVVEVLGPQRARSFRHGEKVDKFTVNDLGPISLAQLKQDLTRFWTITQ